VGRLRAPSLLLHPELLLTSWDRLVLGSRDELCCAKAQHLAMPFTESG
jgi:hypothetical protein